MKQKRIKQLIDTSEVLGFEFDNDEVMYAWKVTPALNKMLAERILESDDGTYTQYYAVPYVDLEACDEIYNDVVRDFVDCYAEDLSLGTADSLALFSDVASKGDDGLMELLSFFGKTYDEFLLDVFFLYGYWINVSVVRDNACSMDNELASDDGERLIKSVLRHLCDKEMLISFDDRRIWWRFAIANGEIWYYQLDCELTEDADYCYCYYGHFGLDDVGTLAELHDEVLNCLDDDGWDLKMMGNVLGMLGITEEELFDLD